MIKSASIEDLNGQTLKSITRTKDDDGGDAVDFELIDGRVMRMLHFQNCCENVTIEDICGDLDDLIGTPILLAECVSDECVETDDDFSRTWTFYKLATVRGAVTLRWYGQSNGYYSKSVDVVWLDNPKQTS